MILTTPILIALIAGSAALACLGIIAICCWPSRRTDLKRAQEMESQRFKSMGPQSPAQGSAAVRWDGGGNASNAKPATEAKSESNAPGGSGGSQRDGDQQSERASSSKSEDRSRSDQSSQKSSGASNSGTPMVGVMVSPMTGNNSEDNRPPPAIPERAVRAGGSGPVTLIQPPVAVVSSNANIANSNSAGPAVQQGPSESAIMESLLALGATLPPPPTFNQWFMNSLPLAAPLAMTATESTGAAKSQSQNQASNVKSKDSQEKSSTPSNNGSKNSDGKSNTPPTTSSASTTSSSLAIAKSKRPKPNLPKLHIPTPQNSSTTKSNHGQQPSGNGQINSAGSSQNRAPSQHGGSQYSGSSQHGGSQHGGGVVSGRLMPRHRNTLHLGDRMRPDASSAAASAAAAAAASSMYYNQGMYYHQQAFYSQNPHNMYPQMQMPYATKSERGVGTVTSPTGISRAGPLPQGAPMGYQQPYMSPHSPRYWSHEGVAMMGAPQGYYGHPHGYEQPVSPTQHHYQQQQLQQQQQQQQHQNYQRFEKGSPVVGGGASRRSNSSKGNQSNGGVRNGPESSMSPTSPSSLSENGEARYGKCGAEEVQSKRVSFVGKVDEQVLEPVVASA
ncbi:hypothetical protein HDU76_002625 [Blyttiomyces sp. JEL0837]|nr:hypothetical protein HDU76_002625 [Blyttiomyces sp. JEL0837]